MKNKIYSFFKSLSGVVKRQPKKAMALMLTVAVLAGMVGFLGTKMEDTKALPVFPNALEQYMPSVWDGWTPGTSSQLGISDMDWSSPTFIHNDTTGSPPLGNDTRAYTTQRSADYNGYSTPDHVVFEAATSSVRFFGTDVRPIMDMVFTEEYGSLESISFDLRPIVMNFHTLHESGFLFSGSFDEQNRYTGYALILRNATQADNQGGGAGTAVLEVLYIEDELFDNESYRPGNVTTTRTSLGLAKVGIVNLTTPVFNVSVEKGPGGRIDVNVDGQRVVRIASPLSDAEGFGFFTGYHSHSCPVLTVMQFENIDAWVSGGGPVETGVSVKFIDRDTGLEIADELIRPYNLSAMDPVLSGERIKITPPSTIGAYTYRRASRGRLDPITLSRSPANNEIILYYEAVIEPSKSASTLVSGLSTPNTGTPDAPVQVAANSLIDYSLNLNNPGHEREAPPDIPQLPKPIAIVGSESYSLMLDENGNLWAWGTEPLDEFDMESAPTLVSDGVRFGGKKLIAVNIGGTCDMALDEDGGVWAWGENAVGQLGNGTTIDEYTPVLISDGVRFGGKKIVAIEVGFEHSLAIDEDGNVWTWGRNNYYQLGDGTTSTRNTPTLISDGIRFGGKKIVAIEAGYYYSIAIDEDGNVWTWGRNNYYQLGDGTTSTRNTPTLISDGIRFGGKKITAISVVSTGSSNLALDEDGKLWAWGYNSEGQLGDGTTSTRNTPTLISNGVRFGGKKLIAISLGRDHGLAVDEDGSGWSWGSNYSGGLGDGTTIDKYTPILISDERFGGKKLIAVEAGNEYSLAIDEKYGVWAWGENYGGQLGTGTLGSRDTPVNIIRPYLFITEISCGAGHSLALDEEGDIWAWGYNSEGQLGDGTTTDRDGPVLISGGVRFGGKKIVTVNAGIQHSFAIDEEGKVWAWGYNDYGQLGDGTIVQKSMPVLISDGVRFGGKKIVTVDAGYNHSLAIDEDGNVWVWGRNNVYQLGDGTTSARNTPTLISNGVRFDGKKIIAVEAGYSYSIALDEDGKVWSWGSGSRGKLGDGTTVSKNTPTLVSDGVRFDGKKIITISVSSAGEHSLALDEDGGVWAWGNGDNGVLGLGLVPGLDAGSTPGLISKAQFNGKDIVAISAGSSHSIALDEEGYVWAWGSGSSGQMGDGTNSGKNIPTVISNGSRFNGVEIADVMAGGGYCFVTTVDGEFWVWGANHLNQFGDGTITPQTSTPRNTPTLHPVLRVKVKNFSLTDLLPAGLSAVTDTSGELIYSITDELGAPVDAGTVAVAITIEGGREKIVFTFTKVPSGEMQFHFSAKVMQPGYFENSAVFTDGPKNKTEQTNPTYHATGDSLPKNVTEKYRIWDNAGSAALKTDTYQTFPTPGDYSPSNSVMANIVIASGPNAGTWRYVGYQRIAGVNTVKHPGDTNAVAGPAPNGSNPDPLDPEYTPQGDWAIKDIDEDLDIIFYFVKDLTVHIDFKDNSNRTSPNLKPRVTNDSVPGLQDYSMPMSNMDPFTVASGANSGNWNYAGYYSLDGGVTIQAGTPPIPAYTATQTTGDKNIVLYFTKQPVFTIEYREYKTGLQDRLNSQMLYNTYNANLESYIISGGAFNPMLDSAAVAPDSTTVKYAINSGVKNFVGKDFLLYRGWSDDDGATVHLDENPPAFTELSANKEIILYFSAVFTITEKFHAQNSPYTQLQGDIPNTVVGGETFTGTPLAEIFDGTNRWEYVGYKVGSDLELMEADDSVQQGDPPHDVIIANVAGDNFLIYCYVKKEVSTQVTITERFREKDNTSNILDTVNDGRTTNVNLNDPFSGSNPNTLEKNGVTYTYWGYQIDSEEPIEGAFVGLPASDGPHTVTYLYAPPVIGTKVLHVRQVVIDPVSDILFPQMGYFRLNNGPLALPVTGPSGANTATLPFASYTVTLDGGDLYSVFDFIPQYYEYAGYKTTPGGVEPNDHNKANMLTNFGNGLFMVDFSADNEWWITVFIKPTKNTGDYDWSWRTNDVGTVYSAP